jgi:hypothetical protein
MNNVAETLVMEIKSGNEQHYYAGAKHRDAAI